MGVTKRPYLERVPRSERIEFRITVAQRLALDRIAREKRRTVSSLADEWIDNLIAENPDADQK